MTLNLKPLFKLAATHGQATAILVAVTVASAGFAGWLHEHDARVSEAATFGVRVVALDTAIARASRILATADTVTVHDSIRVTRTTAKLDTLWLSIPDTLKTAADTAHAIAALPIIRQQSDSTVRACRDQVTSCGAFRAAAVVLEDSLRAKIALLTTHAAVVGKSSHWGCGLTAGVGVVRAAGITQTGPGVLAGCGYRW